MPKVSVIVPVYKTEKFLKKCLDSIISQTLNDIEIICINDGSPDNCLEILNSYAAKDKRIIIINQENSGPSCCRNNGMKVATGEFISFVDSDDWIDKDYLEKLYNAAEKNNADIAVCGIKRTKGLYWRYYLKDLKEEVTENTNRKFQICDVPSRSYVWNKIYRRNKLNQYNLQFVPNRCFEDMIFTPQALFYLGKLVSVPNVYYNYRINRNSIIKTYIKNKSLKQQDDWAFAYNTVMRFVKEHNINISHFYQKTKRFKIFGLTYMKVTCNKFAREYNFFNIVKMLKIKPLQ